MKKGIVSAMIIALFALIFTSCTPNEIEQVEENIIENQEDITPVQGGMFSFSIVSPEHLNPLLPQQEDTYHLLKLIFEPLVSLDKDYKAQGALAEDWEIKDNGERVILNLREDVLWHNGESFTAEDVKFTLDVLKHEDVPSPYTSYVEDIKDYKIINDHKIEILFSNQQGGNIEVFSFPILASHRYDDEEEIMTRRKFSPIGTGPYALENYQVRKEIRLAANEDYWNGTPYIENILVKLLRNNTEIVNSFEAKDTDILRAVEKDWNRFQEDQRLSIYPFTTNNYSFIGLNHENKALRDINVKQAIQLAINREEMLKELYIGQGEIVDIPLSPNSWLYDSSQKPHEYSPQKAKELLKKAGWTHTNNDGILVKEIDDDEEELIIEIIVNEDNVIKNQEANMIRRYLNRVGIGVEIRKFPRERILEEMEDKEFDAILTSWGLSFVPDLSFAFHSREIEEGKNFISYRNRDMDKLLREAGRIENEEERQNIYSNIQSEIAQDLPYINLYFETSAIVVNNRIQGPIEPTDYNIFNNIEQWFVEYR